MRISAMTSKTTRYEMPDTYFVLVKQFPLARIRDEAHREAASEIIDCLLLEDLDMGGQEYLDALTDHVGIYEDEHIKIPQASEADILRELMTANRLSQSQLSREVKITQSTISAVLTGTRTLTRNQVIRVAKRFGVLVSVFPST